VFGFQSADDGFVDVSWVEFGCNLLADDTVGDEVMDEAVVNFVAGEEHVQIVTGLANGAVFSVDSVGSAEALLDGRANRGERCSSEDKSVEVVCECRCIREGIW
jgi:hypothetical protein